MIEIRELSKEFSSKRPLALDKISAVIPKGKIVGLVGPDGAGKTTLIRIIASLLSPTSGFVKVAGKETMKESEAIHYLTGYMPQKFGLYEDLTVYQNLKLYAELRNVRREKEIFDNLLTLTNLHPFTKRLAKHLSGGMKQKLGLACALIKKPLLLLLDEPSVGVDPLSRRELWKMVKHLSRDEMSILWSTAYLDEAQKCDSVLLLNEGKLLYDGSPNELTNQMENRVFNAFSEKEDKRSLLFNLLKDEEIIDGVIQGDQVRIVTQKPFFSHPSLVIKTIEPRFEDAFIDILGKRLSATSKLAERISPISKENHNPITSENLTKTFGAFTAVNSISLNVKKGEIFGLLGPNGAGKTTTFKMLCGLLRPTTGHAFVNGLDLQKAPNIARLHIGYMAQKFSLYGNLTVKQNLNFFAGIYNLQNREKKIAIDEMIEIFKLEHYLSDSAEKLPLGFKQRLSLACANMHRPKILFLDEPTSGVDPITRREFWNHINGLVRKGVTIMITTHFMEEAEYCDRIALIFRGTMIRMASPAELKRDVKSKENPDPTLEDAFIQMIEKNRETSIK